MNLTPEDTAMVIPPIYPERCFCVECPACGISETMIFQSRSFLSPGFRYVPTITSDANGNEIRKRFKPIKGFWKDKPPTLCPDCGAKLEIVPVTLYH